MIQNLWLIGIGTGSPSHITGEGMQALRDAAIILLPQKGAGKVDLAEIRRRILTARGARVVSFDYSVRDPGLPDMKRVEAWHDQIAVRWQAAMDGAEASGPVALLVWGDPCFMTAPCGLRCVCVWCRVSPQFRR